MAEWSKAYAWRAYEEQSSQSSNLCVSAINIMENRLTFDDILNGKLKLLQPIKGPRVNLDTILLSSWVKIRRHNSKILEAGCASGAISLILATKFKNADITGIDIQEDLIGVSKLNSKNNNLEEHVKFIAGDLRDKNLLPREYFDVLVINPPYSSLNSSRESENLSRSTARLELSCNIKDVAELSKRVLKSKGRLFSVFTSERLDEFLASMREYKIIPKKIKFVYPDINKNSAIFLVECIKDGGEGLTILPPLIVRDENNNYTEELKGAYEI